MKKSILLSITFALTTSLFCQTGLYKNFYGVQSSANNFIVPNLASLDTTSDNGYIITANTQQNGTATYLKLDANFNKVWTTDYTINSSSFIHKTAELDDKGFVSLYKDGFNPKVIVKHDASGNHAFSNYYRTANSTNFHTEAICRSNSGDNGFVALYGGCELHYGLTKFDSLGNVVWCKDYAANGYYARTNALGHGVNHGYITCGNNVSNNTPFIGHFDNNGNVVRSKKITFELDPTRGNSITHIFAMRDDHYYALGETKLKVSPYSPDNYMYLMQMDSSLNMSECWKIYPSDSTRLFAVPYLNVLMQSDSTLIISGYTTDSAQSDQQLFIMKFDPRGNGAVTWSRNWISPNTQFNPFSTSSSGLFNYGTEGNIVTQTRSNWDGMTIISIDSAGNGLCNSSVGTIASSVHTNYSVSNINLFQSVISLLKFPVVMTPTNINYSDSILCGTQPTGIESHKKTDITIGPNPFNDRTTIYFDIEQSNSTVRILDFSGKVIKSQSFSGKQLIIERGKMSNGIYVVQIVDTKKNVIHKKIVLQKNFY
ncbi:MAG: T9SS type A sorting domain-containing protein [Vicingaceae bacterium]|nr:T9SS type A sorting domain-containing protein [Vicingaceae bacterium]